MELVGIDYKQHEVDFLEPDLNRDLGFGTYVTAERCRLHPRPEVKAMLDVLRHHCRTVRDAIEAHHAGDSLALRRVYARLAITEPEEARLGLARDGSKGRAVGRGPLLNDLVEVLLQWSELRHALTVVPDILCCAPEFGNDRVSDFVIAICKRQLVQYTQWCVKHYGFDPSCLAEHPIVVWNEAEGTFDYEWFELPTDDHGKPILLVPKDLIRSGPPLDAGRYFRDVYGSGYEGPVTKAEMLADAMGHGGRLEQFAKDRLKDPNRYRARRGLYPPAVRKPRRRK